MQPLISVTLPNYNHGIFLEKAIQSILQQSYKNFEIIIVDDGSTDQSVQIIKKFAKKDSRIKGIYLRRNRGSVFAFKKAFDQANGELIYAFSADDFILNNDFFLFSIKKLNEDRCIAGVSGKAAVIDGQTEEELWQMGGGLESGVVSSQKCQELFFSNKIFIPGISSIWRKKFINEAGGYDASLGPQSDYFINHILPMKHGFYLSNNLFAATRKFNNSYSHSARNKTFFLRHALFQKKTIQQLGENIKAESKWEKWQSGVINARLNLEINKRIACDLEKTFEKINEWEKDALDPYLKQMIELYCENKKKASRRLLLQEENAKRIFKRNFISHKSVNLLQKKIFKIANFLKEFLS